MADQEPFQCDLETLEHWASTWGTIFNAKKCYLMNIARTRNHFTRNYSLNNHILQTVTREKYLGITISNDLNWSTHINTITNKSNSKLGFLRRNLSRCPQKLRETAYLSLVRPTRDLGLNLIYIYVFICCVFKVCYIVLCFIMMHLLFCMLLLEINYYYYYYYYYYYPRICCISMGPRLVKNLNSLEAVQRKAARFVHGITDSGLAPQKALGWKTLEARRRDTKLQHMYNVTHNNMAVSVEEIRMVDADGRTKANHHFKCRAIGLGRSGHSTTPWFICRPHHSRIEQIAGCYS